MLDKGARPERAIGQLGELLAAIHGISIDGFGYLRPDGRGWPVTFDSIMLDLIPRRDGVLDAARHWRVEDSLVNAGLTALSDHAHLYGYDAPAAARRLQARPCPRRRRPGPRAHQWHPRHAGMRGRPPAIDVAYWLAISGERIPLAALLASYPGRMEFVDRNEALIALMIVRRSLWMLMADRTAATRAGLATTSTTSTEP